MSLTGLVLSNNNLTSLAELDSLVNLTKLWLTDNPNLNVSFLPNAAGLRDLRLANTGITDLLVLGNTPNVVSLDISLNAIEDFGDLANLTSLRELSASRMTISLQSLGQLPAISSLRDLWLWGNEISVLADTQNPWVTFYYLPNNPVTCDVQNEFLAAYPNAEIYDAENECLNGRLLSAQGKS